MSDSMMDLDSGMLFTGGQVAELLDFTGLSLVRLANKKPELKNLCRHIIKERRSLKAVLSRFSIEDPDVFMGILRKSGAIVSGSTPLQMILSDDYPDSDLDIYCMCDPLYTLEKKGLNLKDYWSRLGYTDEMIEGKCMLPIQPEHCPLALDLMTTFGLQADDPKFVGAAEKMDDAAREIDYNNPILPINMYGLTKRKVQVIHVDCGSDDYLPGRVDKLKEYILNTFDLSCCRVVLDPFDQTIYSSREGDTINMLMMARPNARPERIAKYVERGFTVLPSSDWEYPAKFKRSRAYHHADRIDGATFKELTVSCSQPFYDILRD